MSREPDAKAAKLRKAAREWAPVVVERAQVPIACARLAPIVLDTARALYLLSVKADPDGGHGAETVARWRAAADELAAVGGSVDDRLCREGAWLVHRVDLDVPAYTYRVSRLDDKSRQIININRRAWSSQCEVALGQLLGQLCPPCGDLFRSAFPDLPRSQASLL